MSLLSRLICAALLALMPGVASAQNLVVVELYTSQGCSSCPPADRFLGDLAERDDVLPLAFHVDYWDYLGWKDDFGAASHTQRQRVYAAQAKRRSIFTPEMIIGGESSKVGHAKRKVMAEIRARAATPALVALEVRGTPDRVEAALTPVGQAAPAFVYLIAYRPRAEVAIARGENRGHTLTYHNVVLEMVEIGRWTGERAETFAGQTSHTQARHAVIVQTAPQGAILAAAKLK